MMRPELHSRTQAVHLAFGARCHALCMLRLRNSAFSVLALVAIGCQSPPPMQPRLDPAPPPIAGAPVKAAPTAWPEEVSVPSTAVDACSGRTPGESCWLHEEDSARNGDCLAVQADAGQLACWTASAR
jgi:hypothetical protein